MDSGNGNEKRSGEQYIKPPVVEEVRAEYLARRARLVLTGQGSTASARGR